ncbi:SMR family transporter [Aquabacterium sp. A7-Y]|uniref:DMT family transporter n=1 Tax=Aquabacterium sp. A7-Y TaxID=1349605 RepID=UPI00223E887F|nr:SMR family transporter [Aquabacterium sp. A7-Y]MCW7536651.1 SMR family transporter [Aquabacterium sp. A7-Y]
MSWSILLIAGLLEVAWATGLKFSEGFTRPVITAMTVAAMVGSVWLLGLAMRQIALGTAYAVWTGIGAMGSALIGMWLFGEAASAARLACLALIGLGIVGLKLLG